jgi:hypothetical protein
MKILNVVPVCVALVLLTVCAGGGLSSAQSSGDEDGTTNANDGNQNGHKYSDASLKGKYALSVEGDWGEGQGFNGIGTIVFNGAGAITGGSLTELVFVSGPSCVGTLAGTYSVSSSGSGTAQITANFTSPSPCLDAAWNGSVSFNIEVAQSGASALIASAAPSPEFTVTVLKQ